MESSKRCLQLLPFFGLHFIWLICTTVYPAHPHAHTYTYFTRRFTQKQKLTLNNPIRKVPNSFHDFNDTCFEWIKYIRTITNSMQCDEISKYYICTRNADSFLYTHQLQWRNRVRKCGVELSLQMIYTHSEGSKILLTLIRRRSTIHQGSFYDVQTVTIVSNASQMAKSAEANYHHAFSTNKFYTVYT